MTGIASVAGAYLLLSLGFAYMMHRVPRRPVEGAPDWGRSVLDTRIPARDGGELEVWRVEPEGRSRGVVVLAHGWGRNRARMLSRARVFGEQGFTTMLHSARDHGSSSPYRFMNAVRFAEDIEAVLDWVREPVLLYGHSAGAAAAVLAAQRNPGKVNLLFLEGCYPFTRQALRSLCRSPNRILGAFFGPMVVLWMDVFYGFRLDMVSPARLAPALDLPVLIIHGEEDESFPLEYAWRLRDSFPAGRAEFFVGKGADHSSSSLTPEYPVAIRSFIGRHVPDSPPDR